MDQSVTIRAVLAGDRDRFAEIVREFDTPVRRIVAREITDAHTLEEIVHATDKHKETALFYQAACLGQLGRLEECIPIREQWLKLFPDSGLQSLELHYLACNLVKVGRTEDATRRWRQVIAEEPAKSNLAELARWYIENRCEKE